jgi:hypothetical protein
MAAASRGRYSWEAMSGPVDDMSRRVAGLWREQGEAFLSRHQATGLDDIARLRGAVIVGERRSPTDGDGPGWHERLDATLSRLRGWDEAVVERLREMRAEEEAARAAASDATIETKPAGAGGTGDAAVARAVTTAPVAARRPRPRRRTVLDLTGEEPMLVTSAPGASICGRCHDEVDDDCLVRPYGTRKPPLCLSCARQIAGVRPRSRR